MSWKGTLLLLILAGVAVCLLLLPGHGPERSPLDPILELDPGAAEKIVIGGGGGNVILVKKNGVWFVGNNSEGSGTSLGADDRADQNLVRKLLDAAASVTPLDELNPEDLKGKVTLSSLDLKSPKRILAISAGKTLSLGFGTDGAAPGQLYARVGSEGPVYLISSELVTLAFHPAEYFRDPRLTDLTPDKLQEVIFSRKGISQQLILKKSSGRWGIRSPVVASGNAKAIDTWLSPLLSAPVGAWMPADSDPLGFGMETPNAVFSLGRDGESTPLIITIGSQVPGTPEIYYARCSDRPGVCSVSGIKNLLTVSPQSLRSRNLKPVEFDAVDRISIRAHGTDLLLARKPGGDDWTIRKGGTGDLSGARVMEWYGNLRRLTAQDFQPATPARLDSSGLNESRQPDRIRLIAHLSENTAEESAGEMVLADYSFGTPVNGTVALREGDAPELMILPSGSVGILLSEAVGWSAATPSFSPEPSHVPSTPSPAK